MEIHIQETQTKQLKFFIESEGKEVGRTSLVIIHNDLHPEPYGLIEDVFVEEAFRGKGIAGELMKQAIETAKELQCYKLVIQSRYGKTDIHEWYQRLGFVDHGKNFRMNF